MSRRLLIGAAAVAAAGLAGWIALIDGSALRKVLRFSGPPIAGAEVALGRELYKANCASCHGADLEGQPDWQSQKPDGTYPAPPHDETGHTWHHGGGMLTKYIRRGGQAVLDDMGVAVTSGMPGFGGTLSDAEIAAILAFIESTWPERIRRFQAERTQAEAPE